jgi:hypothetical protein
LPVINLKFLLFSDVDKFLLVDYSFLKKETHIEYGIKRQKMITVIVKEVGCIYYDIDICFNEKKISVYLEEGYGVKISDSKNNCRQLEVADKEVVVSFSEWLKNELNYLDIDVNKLISVLKEYGLNINDKAIVIYNGNYNI